MIPGQKRVVDPDKRELLIQTLAQELVTQVHNEYYMLPIMLHGRLDNNGVVKDRYLQLGQFTLNTNIFKDNPMNKAMRRANVEVMALAARDTCGACGFKIDDYLEAMRKLFRESNDVKVTVRRFMIEDNDLVDNDNKVIPLN